MASNRVRPDAGAAPKRLDPDARRAQLLEHAISAFADAGIERAAHADVAGRAKMSTPTVFKYFPTRDALVDAVLSEVEDTLMDFRGLLPDGQTLSASELTRHVAMILSQLCTDRPDLMKVALMWTVAFSPVRARYLAFEHQLLDNLSSVMDVQARAQTDISILFASSLLYIRMHFDEATADIRQSYVDRICDIMDYAAQLEPSG